MKLWPLKLVTLVVGNTSVYREDGVPLFRRNATEEGAGALLGPSPALPPLSLRLVLIRTLLIRLILSTVCPEVRATEPEGMWEPLDL